MIKEDKGKFIIYSEAGKKLSRPFASKEEAEERLKQIEFIKSYNDNSGVDDNGTELNKPFINDRGDFCVHAKNKSGETVLVRFSGNPTSVTSQDPSTPHFWNEKVSGVKSQKFSHTTFFDMASRTVRSVRDGVQEYAGIEIGMEPYDKIFTIYRSPETISDVAGKLDGLPITNDHVDANDVSDVNRSDIVGTMASTAVIELHDESTDSSLCIENKTSLNETAMALEKAGKKEFSLGYLGKLKPHDKYDFEQYDLSPTHLALVDSARGGSVLTFVDKKGKNMGDKKLHKVFLDAEGSPNLQQIVEIAQELPEALKTVPMDKLAEIMPMLQEVVTMGKSGDESENSDAPEMSSEDAMEKGKEEMMDQDYEDMDEEEKKKFGDSKLFKSIIASQSKSFADSKVFKDAVFEAQKRHAEVIEKATNFVDEQYSFADKSTDDIMRDALKAEHGNIEFSDSELSIAFKLLKKSESSLKQFGDSQGKNSLDQRIEQDLGE